MDHFEMPQILLLRLAIVEPIKWTLPTVKKLFEKVDWHHVVERYREPVAGDWVRIMHAVLRRKARKEAAGEEPELVSTQDLLDEVDRYRRANTQIVATQSGNYV